MTKRITHRVEREIHNCNPCEFKALNQVPNFTSTIRLIAIMFPEVNHQDGVGGLGLMTAGELIMVSAYLDRDGQHRQECEAGDQGLGGCARHRENA